MFWSVRCWQLPCWPAVPAPRRALRWPKPCRRCAPCPWHEIARYPFGIQDRRCARDTTANYALRDAGRISVVNRCVQADGSVFLAEGVAWVRDPVSNARLEVSFLPAWLRWLPIGRGDYWVIDLAPDYSWVVIGEPQRRYLWILARTPTLPAATYQSIVGRLPAQGYDPARLVPSPGR